MTHRSSDIVVLVESTDGGRPAWWYVKCNNRIAAEKLKGVCRLKRLETIQLTDYGTIIQSGWGIQPPADVVQHMQEQFG